MTTAGKVTGGCLCGTVRYEAGGEPLFAMHCHCRDCQRASGTGHVPVMGVAKSLFKVVRGETKTYAMKGGSGEQSIRHFCANCGSLLFGTPAIAPHSVTIYVGSLDDPSVFKPQAAIFVRDRAPWDVAAGDLQEFKELPTR